MESVCQCPDLLEILEDWERVVDAPDQMQDCWPSQSLCCIELPFQPGFLRIEGFASFLASVQPDFSDDGAGILREELLQFPDCPFQWEFVDMPRVDSDGRRESAVATAGGCQDLRPVIGCYAAEQCRLRCLAARFAEAECAEVEVAVNVWGTLWRGCGVAA